MNSNKLTFSASSLHLFGTWMNQLVHLCIKLCQSSYLQIDAYTQDCIYFINKANGFPSVFAKHLIQLPDGNTFFWRHNDDALIKPIPTQQKNWNIYI
jgi:hypothetical protein